MANTFLTLTPPIGNGHGAAVDVSTMGGAKTIAIGSSGGRYEPNTTIESSNDGVSWAPVKTFQGPGVRSVSVACKFLRETVTNLVDGVSPAVGVGSNDDGTTISTLSVPAGNGHGVPFVSTGLQTFKSIQVGGAFKGVLNVEVSDDGGVTYSTVASFSAPGVQSSSFAADHIRVTRAGVPVVGAGLPTVIIGDSGSGGGGGGGSTIDVQHTGVLVGTFSTLDFNGAGVSVGPEGPGVVNIDVAALTVSQSGVVIGNLNGTTQLDFVGASLTDLGGGEVRVSVSGTKQIFRYTAQPGDGTSIVIGVAQGFTARANTNYNVQVTQGAHVAFLNVAATGQQLAQFTLQLSAPPTAGDVFMFTVEDLT